MQRVVFKLLLQLLLPLIALVATPVLAAVVNVDGLPARITLDHGELAYLRDPGGDLTLAKVHAEDGHFVPVTGFLSQGFTTDVYWLRLRLQRDQAPAGWWLQISPSSLDDLTLYQLRPDGSVVRKRSGGRLPMSVRDAAYSDFLFRLNLPPGESTLYLRVQTRSSMVVMAHLERLDRFPVEATTNFLVAGLYLGVIFTVLVLSGVYLLIRRQRLYAIYFIYLLCQLAYVLCSQGMASLYLFPELPDIPVRLRGAVLSTMIVLGILFFERLLHLQEGNRWRRWACQLLIVVGAMTAVASGFGNFGALAPWMWLTLLLVMVVCLPPVLRHMADGRLEDRIFAASFVAFLVFVMQASLTSTGALPMTEAGRLIGKLGNVLHLLLLQLTVMLRIRSAEREALLARQEVELQQRRMAEQDQFIAMITHEIRTPVSVINAAAESLRMIDTDALLPQHELRYQRIAQAVKRVDHLIAIAVNRDRLNQVTHGEMTAVDMVALTQSIVEQLPAEQRQRLRLEVAEASAMVRAYPELLQFSLLNLIDNACKYSPPDSPVCVSIAVSARERAVSWSVLDEGPGVHEAVQARVFDRYYRAAESTGMPGLGLGLYIAQRFIQRFQGQLHYHQRSPAGACFEIRLPLLANS